MRTVFTSPLAEALAQDTLDRFLRYARIDTKSALDRTQSPSTPGQWDLLRLLERELREIDGIEDVTLDENGYVFATLPATVPGDLPVIGLLAHVDTSPEVSGEGVDPIVHEDYDGGVIELPRNGVRLDPADIPALARRRGHDVVTAGGDTLLGADDKAGVAEIMAAAAYLAAHPEIPRPTLRLGFTPDEEVGMGAALFDIERFGATFAYTMDASEVGELQDETFTAAEVIVDVHGVDIHPGYATGVMVSAARLAARILSELPTDRLTPDTTSGREGFVHPIEMSGGTAFATIRFIARDFDDDRLAEHVALLRETAERVAASEPRARIEVTDTAQYPNMRRFIEPHPEIIEVAERALRAEGIERISTPIRGGTDGSQLSAMGLPTPNIFAGGHEFHSPREWVTVQDMAAAAAVIVHLAEEWAKTA